MQQPPKETIPHSWSLDRQDTIRTLAQREVYWESDSQKTTVRVFGRVLFGGREVYYNYR